MLRYKVSLVKKGAAKSKNTVVFKVVPYRHRTSSAICEMFLKHWDSVTSALLHCRRFPAHNFTQTVRSILFFTPLFLPSTPVQYVINIVV